MRSWRIGLLFLMGASWLPQVACADYPHYFLLRPATHHAPPGPRKTYYPGHASAVQTHAYAYGWFGAAPRQQQWSRHFGYYRDHTEWTAR